MQVAAARLPPGRTSYCAMGQVCREVPGQALIWALPTVNLPLEIVANQTKGRHHPRKDHWKTRGSGIIGDEGTIHNCYGNGETRGDETELPYKSSVVGGQNNHLNNNIFQKCGDFLKWARYTWYIFIVSGIQMRFRYILIKQT